MQDKKSISLTIKPTNLCNFRCKHCFNGEHLYDKELLSIELACKTLELVAKKYNTIKVTFHGGEPTLVGKKYYEDLFAYEKELKKAIINKVHPMMDWLDLPYQDKKQVDEIQLFYFL